MANEPLQNDSVSLEEQAALLVQEAPVAVREFITGSDRTTFIKKVATAFSLSPEISHALERELILMLLGATDPSEFESSLIEEGVSHETLEGILKEIDNLHFFQKETPETLPAIPEKHEIVVTKQAPAVTTPTKPVAPAPTRPVPPPPPNTTPLVKEYAADPYREPLE